MTTYALRVLLIQPESAASSGGNDQHSLVLFDAGAIATFKAATLPYSNT